MQKGLYHISYYGHYGIMKTTLDIHDELLLQAKRHAKAIGRPLRVVVEEGLRAALHRTDRQAPYALPDLRVGDPTAVDPLASYAWPELREMIYIAVCERTTSLHCEAT